MPKERNTKHLLAPVLSLVPLVLISAFLFGINVFAFSDTDSGDFFSYKRHFLDEKAESWEPQEARTKRFIAEFLRYYKKGTLEIANNRVDQAIKDISKARQIWPEYFESDFLLARLYEDKGDHELAARYYKSYLIKLNKYHAGEYRISGQIIRYFVPVRIEDHATARDLIIERLKRYGIDPDKVRPVITPPVFLLPLAVLAGLAAAYGAAVYTVFPYLRKIYRIKNPPEGYWVCPKCGTGNTELNKVCEKCGKKKDERR